MPSAKLSVPASATIQSSGFVQRPLTLLRTCTRGLRIRGQEIYWVHQCEILGSKTKKRFPHSNCRMVVTHVLFGVGRLAVDGL